MTQEDAEALAAEYVTEGYRVNDDGTPGMLDAVMILDEAGDLCVSFSSPLLALKIAQRMIEIAARISEAKAAAYDEITALNTLFYGQDLPAPLLNLGDYSGGAL
ncbi:hypothetical protein [Leucobacter sp. W1478]|uniref:hypothetical protein n=1 Tax=Leucobacter sp. W1478 TaxID=3439065 RepID=UPI003F3899AD